jgi:hypothetical protein
MNNKKAKDIFFRHNGQHYHMAHNGYFDEYKKYNIDEETEEKWVEELVDLRFNEFKETSDMKYLYPLVDYLNRYELLDELLLIKPKGTYINQFVIIEMLAKLLHKNKKKIVNYNDKKKIFVDSIFTIIGDEVPIEYEGYNIENRKEKIKKKLQIK